MIGKVSFLVGCSAAAYLYFKLIPEIRAYRSTRKMNTDRIGNYDMDGVSYDPLSRSVVVAGDERTPDPLTEVLIVAEVVSLHAHVEPKERSLGA